VTKKGMTERRKERKDKRIGQQRIRSHRAIKIQRPPCTQFEPSAPYQCNRDSIMMWDLTSTMSMSLCQPPAAAQWSRAQFLGNDDDNDDDDNDDC